MGGLKWILKNPVGGNWHPEFEQAVRDNPDNVKALDGLGYIYCCQGRFGEAVEAYQAAVRIDPDSAIAQFGLAEVFRKQHRNDDAIDQYSLALKLDPNLANAHYELAALYGAKHDDADAISQLQETVRLEPDSIQNASADGQTNLVADMTSRLKLYQRQQAYRE